MDLLSSSGRLGGPRRRLRGWQKIALLAALLSLVAACSSTGSNKSTNSSASTSPTTSTSTSLADNGTTPPTTGKADFGGGTHAPGTDIGLTATQIKVGLIADVNNPVAPGVFKNNVTAVRAWADLVNANGGLAGRKVVIDFCDGQINANATTNCVIKACQNDFALVGTAANVLVNLSDLDNCKDAAGKALGLPNLAFIAFAPLNCDKVTYVLQGMGSYCATQSENPQTYTVNVGDARYYKTQVPDLHGTWVYSSDVPSVKLSLLPAYIGQTNVGVGKDGAGFYGVQGAAPQSALTPIVQAMKAAKSTYGYGGATAGGTVLLRREAAIQGVNSVKIWACNSQCYTTQFIQQGGSAVNGEYSQLFTLPIYSEYQNNPTLKALVDKVGGVANTDSNAVYSFLMALLFQDAVRKAAAAGTLNRATLFEQLNKETAFDADGIIGQTNVAARTPSPCDVIVKLVNGKYERVFPAKPGTFDCNPANLATVKTNISLK